MAAVHIQNRPKIRTNEVRDCQTGKFSISGLSSLSLFHRRSWGGGEEVSVKVYIPPFSGFISGH